MINIPIEAWSVEGISALASSLSKPLVMDAMTANMCQYSVESLFGHCLGNCTKRPRTEEEKQRKNVHNQNKNWQQRVHNGNGNRQEYMKRNVNNVGVNDANKSVGQNDKGKVNQVNKGTMERNKFEVLNEVNTNEDSKVRTLKDRLLKEQEDKRKNVEDVFDNEDGISQTMTWDNVIGLSKGILK
ncbi:hypothetical protein Tco_1351941 [Tanacetum coccineum]